MNILDLCSCCCIPIYRLNPLLQLSKLRGLGKPVAPPTVNKAQATLFFSSCAPCGLPGGMPACSLDSWCACCAGHVPRKVGRGARKDEFGALAIC